MLKAARKAAKGMEGSDTAAAMAAAQSALAQIATALGVDGGNTAAVLAAAHARAAGSAMVTALQSRIDTLESAGKRQAAEACMTAELAAKRGIPVKDQEGLIALHMQGAARARHIAGLHPSVAATGTAALPPAAQGGQIALSAEEVSVADQMGFSHQVFLTALNDDRAKQKGL